MRAVAFGATFLLALQPLAATAAGVLTIRDVRSAAAVMSADRQSVVISATVDLPNGCWTHPRVAAPRAGALPDASGSIDVEVIADSTAGPGLACPMIYRPNVEAAPLRWTGFPPGLKAVRLVGSRSPVVAPITPEQSSASP